MAAAPSSFTTDAAAPMVPSREVSQPSLFSIFNAPSKSHYDNSSARRRLSGHRRGSSHSNELQAFASKKFPFSFFNTDDDQDREERVHPLFAAIALGATQDVIHSLYECCPKALGETTTRGGLTPLHLAAKYGASVKVIEFLLRHCPSHANRKTKSSWSTPLHLAAAANGGSSAEVIRALVVKSHHSALAVQDRRGNTPLHCAALSRSSSSDEVIRLLVAFRRSALTAENDMGMTPVHCACASGALNPATVVDMIRKSPSGATGAASAVDSHGNVALHYAGSHGSSASALVARALLEADPSSASKRNRMGHGPLDVAAFDSSTPRSVLDAIESAVRLTTLSSDGDAAELHASMLSQEWSEGADLVLDARPSLVHRKNLDDKVLPAVVKKLERRREQRQNLGAFFELVKGMPHLVGR